MSGTNLFLELNVRLHGLQSQLKYICLEHLLKPQSKDITWIEGKPIKNSVSDTKFIAEVYSLNALICALSFTNEFAGVNWCGTFGANKQQTAGNFQFTRDNRFDIQVEYARKIAEICGAKFQVRHESKITFFPNFRYIVDINSVRARQNFSQYAEISFLAVTPETVTPLLGLTHLIGYGSLKSRVACLRDYYVKKRIRSTFSPFEAHWQARLFFNVKQLDQEELAVNVKNVSLAFAKNKINGSFTNLYDCMNGDKNIRILILLPLPKHYGGNSKDDIAMASYVRDNFDWEKYLILVKNHPSDKESHQLFEKILGSSNFYHWNDLYDRNLPIELISISFQDRVTLISTGTTSVYTIKAKSSVILWPSGSYARKLARNNYAPSANHLGIQQFFIES